MGIIITNSILYIKSLEGFDDVGEIRSVRRVLLPALDHDGDQLFRAVFRDQLHARALLEIYHAVHDLVGAECLEGWLAGDYLPEYDLKRYFYGKY